MKLKRRPISVPIRKFVKIQAIKSLFLNSFESKHSSGMLAPANFQMPLQRMEIWVRRLASNSRKDGTLSPNPDISGGTLVPRIATSDYVEYHAKQLL